MTIEKPSEWFDRVLPQTVKNEPEKVDGFTGRLFFEITGDDGGEWMVTFEDDGVRVLPGGDKADAEFSVKMKSKNFVKMMNGDMSGANAFMTGKLKFKGDVSKAMKLRGLLFAG